MGGSALTIQRATPEEASRACGRLTALLPDWFGIPEANAAYAAGVAECICFGTCDEAGDWVGLVALRPHFGTTLEVWWMAVDPDRHRQGIGAGLMKAALQEGRRLGCSDMVLMTLGDECDDPGYAATRRFYVAQGFRPLVHDHMGDLDTPMIWMIRSIDASLAPLSP